MPAPAGVAALIINFIIIAGVQKAHHMIIDGSTITVDMELGRTLKGWIPRRLGESRDITNVIL